MYFRYAGPGLFNVEKGSTEHHTIVFNAFVFMQLFNEINSRKLEDGIIFLIFFFIYTILLTIFKLQKRIHLRG